MLQQQCGDLATAGTLGFTTDDCTQVADAVQATELAQSPLGKSAQPADPAIGCPMGTEEQILFDGEATTKNFRTSSWWTRAPNLAYGIPSNERSAGGSWAGVDFFKNAKSSFKGAVDVKLPAGQKSYLRFAQWYSFAYQGTWYPHGGSVSLLRKTSSGYKSVDIASKAWVNGPNHKITGAGVRGFGGDSHGWYTSRASLTSLAGKKIRPVFTTYGENVGNYSPYIAWYLDDIQVYTCRPFTPPSAVTAFDGAIGGTDAQPDVTLTWAAPTDLGEGFTGYLVGGAGAQQTLATDATSVTFSGLDPTRQYTLWVRPLGKEGVLGPRRTFLAGAPVTSLSLEYPKVKKSQLPRLDGRVSSAGPIPFRVEFRRVRSSTWKPLPWPAGGPEIVWSTDKKGRFWATYDRPRHPIVIRVVFDIGPHTFAGSSPEVTQRLG